MTCQYCGAPDKRVVAVIYGEPMPDVITVVDSDGCRVCAECAKPALWLAMQEWDWTRPVVRLIPIKAA